MKDNYAACAQAPALYHPYVELQHGDGRGLVAALAKEAAVVVSDDYPCFFHPHMMRKVAKTLPARLELVDANEARRLLEMYRGEPAVYSAMAPAVMKLWARTAPEDAMSFALTNLPARAVQTR